MLPLHNRMGADASAGQRMHAACALRRRYILSEQLTISSNQVLRGAGRDLTTLYFSRSLSMINGWGSKWQAGRENSPYTCEPACTCDVALLPRICLLSTGC